jgi:hypothetical protein
MKLRFAVLGLALALGCGPTYVGVRPTERLAAAARGVQAEVTRLWITDDVQRHGFDDEPRLVVELSVRNDGAQARRLSPGSLSCVMHGDARRPGQARMLLAGGGGEGTFPGELPDEGSLLAPVTIPPGQSRVVWAVFHGYRFDGSEIPRRLVLTVPVEGLAPLELVLADPARGDLRWETPPVKSAFAYGVKNVTLLAPGLGGSAPSAEIVRLTRSGRFLWDVGLLSTVFARTQGHRLTSETNVFSGVGLTAHLTLPLLSWGTSRNPVEVGVYGGGAASFLAEIARSHPPSDMYQPHIYGFVQAEAGLELDIGILRLASTPFPLAAAGRGLPRWIIRLGYVQSWAGDASSAGFATTLRFTF